MINNLVYPLCDSTSYRTISPLSVKPILQLKQKFIYLEIEDVNN